MSGKKACIYASVIFSLDINKSKPKHFSPFNSFGTHLVGFASKRKCHELKEVSVAIIR